MSASDNAIDEEEQTRVEVYMPEKEADEDEYYATAYKKTGVLKNASARQTL